MKRILLVAFSTLAAFGCASNPNQGEVADNTTFSTPVLSRTPSQDEGYDVLQEGKTVNLEKCGGKNGTATMVRSGGQLVIQIRGIECGKYKTMYMRDEEGLTPEKRTNSFWKDLVVNEDDAGWHTFTVGSNAYFNDPKPGSKGDIVQFYVPAKRVVLDLRGFGNKTPPMGLNSCRGTVQAQINKDRSLAVVFRDVEKCGQFEITGANGESMNMHYDLQDQGNAMGGGFTLSPKLFDYGSNGVTMRVFRRGGGENRILLRFYAN